ncbi:hypothetical protein K8R47_00450, partial [archaeon]|nr:hypothetical protein [archaeon]
ELGGNIKLAGFNELEPGQLVVVKKIVGNYVKKIQDKDINFNELSVHLRKVHSSGYEIQAKLIIDNQPKNSEVIDHNLFFALTSALNKLS